MSLQSAAPVVIDGKGHLLGRLASIVAKQLLNGQKVVVVRCELINASGSFFRAKVSHTAHNRHYGATERTPTRRGRRGRRPGRDCSPGRGAALAGPLLLQERAGDIREVYGTGASALGRLEGPRDGDTAPPGGLTALEQPTPRHPSEHRMLTVSRLLSHAAPVPRVPEQAPPRQPEEVWPVPPPRPVAHLPPHRPRHGPPQGA